LPNQREKHGGARILVVEGATNALAVAVEGLAAAGFVVDRADSSTECLHAVRGDRYDLILLDATHPDENRGEIAKHLKDEQAPNGRCAILLSAPEPVLPTRAMEFGAQVDGVIVWPASVDDILAKVQATLARHRTRHALYETDSIYWEIFEHFPIGVAVIAPDARFLRVNAGFCEMTGYAPAELTAMTFADITHPEDRAESFVGQENLIAGKIELFQAEKRYVRKDAASVWVRIFARLVRDAFDKPLYFLTLVENVTEIKQTRDALQESEGKYRKVVENLNEGIWVIDKEANTTFVNARMAEMLGYTPEEMRDRPFFAFMDERGIEISQASLERRKQGISEDHELELHRKDGTRIVALMHASPMMDADGNYLGALAGVLDITRRKQIERDLHQTRADLEARVQKRTADLARANVELKAEVEERKRAETLFRQLLDSAPDAMVITNQDGKITLVNAITQELFGYERDELVGQSIEILVPEHLRGSHKGHRHSYGGNPHVRRMGAGFELSGRRKDGSVFPAEISLGPLHTEQGLLVFSAIRDVTLRKQAEQELRDSREQFDLAVRGTDAGIWDWNLRTNDVYYSPRWKSILGYEDHEIENTYEEWERRLHPDDRERALGTVKDYLEGRTTDFELECRMQHKNGSYRWIFARGAAVSDEKGRPYRMVGSHLDVTERKKNEDILKENEAQLKAAQRIQEHLLPHDAPTLPGFEIAGAYHPADFAAGDHFDYFEMGGGSLGIVIGDVSGHGFSSALLMASVHAHLRSLADAGFDIDEIMTRANSSLIKQTDPGHFVTAILARLDPVARKLSYVSAGHPTAYVLASSGEVKARLRSTAMPLAIMPEAEFSRGETVDLAEGDIVMLLTDGVLEAAAPDGEFFDSERARLVVHENRRLPAAEIAQRICSAAREFCQPGSQEDDVTAVIIKVLDPPR
jgi:PAS domain S-box-containing protein